MCCASEGQSALANVPEIKDLNTKPDPNGGSATFMVTKGFDYSSKLNELSEETHEIQGWKEMD